MAFGEIRCIFCRVRMPLVGMYPWVGRVLQCGGCRGFMLVEGHYLEFNGKVSFAIRRLTPPEIARVNKALNMKPLK
jgi:hypothetical protein